MVQSNIKFDDLCINIDESAITFDECYHLIWYIAQPFGQDTGQLVLPYYAGCSYKWAIPTAVCFRCTVYGKLPGKSSNFRVLHYFPIQFTI